MQDMLVKLYGLPSSRKLCEDLKNNGVEVRRPLAAEKSILTQWVLDRWDEGWASEVEVAFSFHPISSFIALHNREIIGFACYDSAYRNFFGPTSVDKEYQGNGVGKLLLLKCLEGMRAQGYAYAIIGGVGPAEFYEKAVNAKLIDGSDPGIYRGILSPVPVD